MKTFFLFCLIFILAGCTPLPSSTSAPVAAIASTATIPAAAAAVTPAPTSLPTAAPLDPGRPVTFAASNGVTLSGVLYGQGTQAVIFSNMGDQHPASWAAAAQAAAAAGFLALTYDFRYWVSGKMDTSLMPYVGDDLSAAAAFVRLQGARQVALVGASMGGVATAKAAAAIGASAVVIIAAPMQVPGVDLSVSPAELQAILAPKLFVTSENDDTVSPEELQAMYVLAVEPKELYIYPDSTAHGTLLFQTHYASDLLERILAFVKTNSQP